VLAWVSDLQEKGERNIFVFRAFGCISKGCCSAGELSVCCRWCVAEVWLHAAVGSCELAENWLWCFKIYFIDLFFTAVNQKLTVFRVKKKNTKKTALSKRKF